MGREDAGEGGSVRRYDERIEERRVSDDWCCSVIGTIHSFDGRVRKVCDRRSVEFRSRKFLKQSDEKIVKH